RPARPGRSGRGRAAPGGPGSRLTGGRIRRGARCRPGRPPGRPHTRRAAAAYGVGNASASVTSLEGSSSPEGCSTSRLGNSQPISDSRSSRGKTVDRIYHINPALIVEVLSDVPSSAAEVQELIRSEEHTSELQSLA